MFVFIFRNIGWRFYLCLIIPGTVAAILILLYFPDTLGLPLEEIAAIFGVSPPRRQSNIPPVSQPDTGTVVCSGETHCD